MRIEISSHAAQKKKKLKYANVLFCKNELSSWILHKVCAVQFATKKKRQTNKYCYNDVVVASISPLHILKLR